MRTGAYLPWEVEMKLAFLLTVTLVAGGCASAKQPQSAPAARDVDEAWMQRVDDEAARRGVRVHWVNPPRKASPAADG